jgi:hypothetical protein
VAASIVLSRDLHIQMVFAAVGVPVLDLTVRELHVPIPVRQVVLMGPLLDFARVAIRPSVGVRPAAIALVQPLLVLALQLLLQAHALKLHSLCLELCGITFIRAIDLTVVFELPLARDARMERLPAVVVAIAIRFKHVPAAVGQDDRLLSIAGDADGLDQTLFAEVPEVSVARIARPIVTVAEVAGGHDTKRADSSQRPALRAAERVFAVTRIADDFTVVPARQIQTASEHLAWVTISVTRVALSVGPARIVPIAVVGSLTCLGAVIATVALVLMFLDA